MIYLNQAGTSWPKPAPVRAAVADALAAPPESWAHRLESQHSEVCRAFGISDPADLLLAPSATSALAVAISDHPWEPGDRVIVSGLEHHALYRPVQQLGRRGVEVVVARRAEGEPVALEAVEAELRRGRVRMLAMTAASNVTGEMLPIGSLVGLAREHGALCLIDAAQVAGWLPLDLGRLGADLVVFAGHKGPQAPWGVGGLYMAPEVAMASPLGLRPSYCDVGSVDRAALAGLVAGLRWLDAPERAERLAVARERAARIVEALADHPAVVLHGPRRPEARMPTLALSVEGHAASDLAAALSVRGVLASGGQQCAPLAHETLGTAPDGVLRLSVGPSNGDEDVATAIEALLDVIGQG